MIKAQSFDYIILGGGCAALSLASHISDKNIDSPSFLILEKRLLKRGLDSENVIETRLKNAKEELKYAEEFDYRILNEDYDLAYKDIKDIVIDGKSIDNRDKINLKILRDMLS